MPQRERIRALRRDMTDAERRLWTHLRNRDLCGEKFRRQAPIGRYVVDFFCFRLGLVIELDGGQHAEHEAHDAKRTAYLEGRGLRVLRFWNHDVLANAEGVLEAIRRAVEARTTEMR